MAEKEEVVLRGLPVSKGIGIGFPFFFSTFDENIAENYISLKEIDAEIIRYRSALEKSREDVIKLQKISIQENPPEIVAILGTHLELLRDPLLTTRLEEQIRARQQKTESVFFDLIEEYKQRFSTLQDVYFQERCRDIVDVSRRILNHLRPLEKLRIGNMPHNSIIMAHDLVPSEAIEASGATVNAFVTATGGITSHVAIIARAKGLPYVANIDIKMLKKIKFQSIIVDGSQGVVIINPHRGTLKRYVQLKRSYLEKYKKLQSATNLKGETIDGYEIRIFANLEKPTETHLLHKCGAAGIGLFRSEYLFLTQQQFPTEDEQFEIYKQMARKAKERPVIVRIFDVGSDKMVDFFPEERDAKYFIGIRSELNPALGCRGIRLLLRYPDILKTQLRALLRASHYGNIYILIPMVSDLIEIRQVRIILQALSEELRKNGIKVAKNVPLGCMIEVPSIAMMCDMLVKESDFLSIGTNDLVQYVLAADRNNPNTSDLYLSNHPGVLRLIRMIIASAHEERKPLIMCGEYATDPMMIPILIGLGIREFSVSLRDIPLVKHTIRKWRILEACRLAEGALECSSAHELKEYLSVETDR